MQIWHGGRTAHPDRNGGVTPISSSPLAVSGNANTPKGVVPKEATLDDIKDVIKKFRKGAENALEAGFDGIQLHAAHGYIID